MFFIRSGINFNIVCLLILNFLLNKLKRQKNKTYDYTQYICGCDYVFEVAEGGTTGYMTGQGKGIKPGDYIILRDGSILCRYQVAEIDYYAEPPDMWMALLQKVTVDSQ
ncbi:MULTISPECIES: hypothetical protein [Nostocales]|uniref:Uncharacterized protein n=3 Tax=Nostocales TaxID=1161 RepID=A0A0C1NDN0_9CYAN|nr:hypothetical protein [Tolypothrix bouteillei]KAF3886916.1 hypothetical protein DA73_0400016535 [Tolypothrix bouteillei VB521301]